VIKYQDPMECIFCKIAKKEIPSEVISEDGEFLVFKDINPQAPVHVLIIPKNHLEPVSAIDAEQSDFIGRMIFKAKTTAEELGVSNSGYRLIFNVGRDAGMEVDHLHLHLLAGKLS
jgi:histidine triad (HIT) family protein